MVIKAVKGVKDILPADTPKWREVERVSRETFARFGFKEITLPIFEKSEVFIKAVGETTDIVQKEMYTFADRGNESLTLRPEGTASCVRAYIEHSMYHPKGTVTPLYYFGPMFRRERPQAGRFRQFFQIGAELFGTDAPEADAEVIHLLIMLLKGAGLKDLKLMLNSLGCNDCRPNFKAALVEYLSTRTESLCDNCKERYETNPLRVIDCKSSQCGETVKNAPTINAHLCSSCNDHLSGVERSLNLLGIMYELKPTMVRGLDYYNRTVFEVTAGGLGAQNSVAGGGRYDDLVKSSGGPDVPAIGFAIGVERLIESAGSALKADEASPEVYIVHLGDEAREEAFSIAGSLRELGVKVLCPYNPAGMKNQIGKADKSGAKLALIIGEDEIKREVAVVRRLDKGVQEEYPLERIEHALAAILGND